MARPKKDDGDARARLVDAARRGFRASGFGGAGVDALAKGAGLTSGAFYAHFDSKAEAFRLAVVAGLSFLRGAHARQRALALLAILSGAAAMARAVRDGRARRDILAAANVAAKAI